MEMAITIESIREAVASLRNLLPADFKPELGIIGGSGLSALEDAVEQPKWEVPYGKIKGFPVSTGKCYIAWENVQVSDCDSSWSCGQVGFWSCWG